MDTQAVLGIGSSIDAVDSVAESLQMEQSSSFSFTFANDVPTTLDVGSFYATFSAKRSRPPAPPSPKKVVGRGKPTRSHPFLRDKNNVCTNSHMNGSLGYWIDSQNERVYVNEVYLTSSQEDRKQMLASRNLVFVPYTADSVLQQNRSDSPLMQPVQPSLPSPSKANRSPRSKSCGNEASSSSASVVEAEKRSMEGLELGPEANIRGTEDGHKSEEDEDFSSFLQAVEGMTIEDVLEIQKYDPFSNITPDIFKPTTSSRSWTHKKVLHGKEKIAYLKLESKKSKKVRPIDKSSNLTMKTAVSLTRNHVEVFNRLSSVFQEKKNIEAAKAAWESMKAKYNMHVCDERAKKKVAPRYLDYTEIHYRNIAAAKEEKRAREEERLRAEAETEAKKKKERRRKWRKAQGYDTEEEEEEEEEVIEEETPAEAPAVAAVEAHVIAPVSTPVETPVAAPMADAEREAKQKAVAEEAKAARQKAIGEEEAAKQKALAEEETARQKAIGDEEAAKQKAVAAEETARQKAIGEEEAAKQKALAEEETAKQKVIGEEEAAKQKALTAEETARQKAIADEEAAKQKAVAAEEAAKQKALTAEEAAKQKAVAAEEAAKQKAAAEEEATKQKALAEEEAAKQKAAAVDAPVAAAPMAVIREEPPRPEPAVASAESEVPDVIRDIFDELRGAADHVAVSDIRSWGDVTEMVAGGIMTPAELDDAIATVAGTGDTLGLYQLFDFLGILDRIADSGNAEEGEGDDEDVDVHDLAKGNKAASLAKLLRRRPELLNLRNGLGQTPLHKSCSYSALDAVKVLLRLKADMAIGDKYGDTPLHCACTEGHLEMCSALVLQGADIYVRNMDNQKPLDQCPSKDMAEQLRKLYVQTLQV